MAKPLCALQAVSFTHLPRHHSSYRLISVDTLDHVRSLEEGLGAHPAVRTLRAPMRQVSTA